MPRLVLIEMRTILTLALTYFDAFSRDSYALSSKPSDYSVYDILFDDHLNFCAWFAKTINIK